MQMAKLLTSDSRMVLTRWVIFLMTVFHQYFSVTSSSCLTFTLKPSRVVEGQSVELNCHINNLPENPPYYKKTWHHHYQAERGYIGAKSLYTLLRDGTTHTDTVGKDFTGRIEKVNDDVIRLNQVTQQNVGLYYSCYLDSDLSGCISSRASVILTVIVPVSNVKLSVTSVKQGERATFRCTADGDTPITYTWQKVAGSLPGGGRWQGGSDGSVTLSNVQRSDAGSYTCKADNEANKPVTSDQVYFDVYYAPSQFVLTSSPSDLTHRDNDNTQVALTCSAAGGHPAPDVILYRGTIRVTSGTSQVTHRRRLQKSDNQVAFVCRATSKGIRGEMSSNKIIYNVTFPPEGVCMIPNPGGAVNINTDVTLRCLTTTSSNPPVTFEWLIDNSNPLGNVSTSQTNGNHNGKVAVSEMKLKASRQNNGAVVTCRVKSFPRITDSYTMNVLFPPTKVTTTESPPGAVRTGSSKQLTCTTDSANPSAVITWMRNGVTESDRVQLTNPDGDYQAKKTSSTITITTTRNHNNNQYSCEVKHQSAETTALKRKFKLNVTYPHTVTVQIQNAPVTEGGHVILTCDAAGGNPQNVLSYEWHHTSQFRSNRGNLAADKLLVFSNITYKDAGKYECHVTNAGGTSSDQKNLTVFYTAKLDPVFENHKSVKHSDYGENVTFILKVISYPLPEFNWTYKTQNKHQPLYHKVSVKNQALQSELTVYNVMKDDFIMYICVVMNSVGSSVFQFELKPAAAPDTPARFQLVYTSVTTVTLSWISSFSGGYPQTFHIMYRETDERWPVKPQIQNIADPGEGSEVTYKLTGLHRGTSYEFRVKALNSRPTGPNSSDFTSAVKTTTKENPSVTFSVVRESGSSTAEASWSVDRGRFTHLVIQICETECHYHNLTATEAANQKTVITGLEPDKIYTYNLMLYDKGDLIHETRGVNSVAPSDPVNPVVIIAPVVSVTLLVLVAVALVVAFLIYRRRRGGRDKRGLMKSQEEGGYHNNGFNNEMNDLNDLNQKAKNVANIEDKSKKTGRNATPEQESVLYAEVDKKNKKKTKQELDNDAEESNEENENAPAAISTETQAALYAEIDTSKKKNKKEKQETQETLNADVDKSKKKHKKEKQEPAEGVTYAEIDKSKKKNKKEKLEPEGATYAEIDKSKKKNKKEKLEPQGALYAEIDKSTKKNKQENPGKEKTEVEKKLTTNTQSEPQDALYAEIDKSTKKNKQQKPEILAAGGKADESAYQDRSELEPGASVKLQPNADENAYQNFEELKTGKKETIQMQDQIVGADGTLYENPRNFDFEGSAKPSQKPKPKLKPRPNPKSAPKVDEPTEYACLDFTRKV